MARTVGEILFQDTNVLLAATDEPQPPRIICLMGLIHYESCEETQT